MPSIRRRTVNKERSFRCEACGTTWPEDDLQQIQPDGRYACPFEKCGTDTLTEVRGINRP